MSQPVIPAEEILAADFHFMRMALNEARRAAMEGEVPVGAVITDADGRIIASAHNMTQALNDVTAHAEMLAVTAAAHLCCGQSVVTMADLDGPSLCAADPFEGGPIFDGATVTMTDAPGLGILGIEAGRLRYLD